MRTRGLRRTYSAPMPFGAVRLVRRERHQVHLQLLQVDLDLAGGLGRVHVEDDALLAADLAQRGDVLDDADLVVDHHHRHQDGIRAQRSLERIEAEQTIVLDIQVGHFKALAFELPTGIQHRLVFGLDGNDVLAALGVEIRRALDGQVVRLGGAGSPDDLARIGVDQLGDFLAGLLDRVLGFPAKGVAARGRIAETLVQPGNHFLDHARVDRRGSRVVQVDGAIAHVVLLLTYAVALAATGVDRFTRTAEQPCAWLAASCNWRTRC